MHAILRRYEGVDQSRRDELVRKVDDSLIPRLAKLPGFTRYYVVEAGDGVMSSIGVFETLAQADESSRIAAAWVREEDLESALPNPPSISGGEVIFHKANGRVET